MIRMTSSTRSSTTQSSRCPRIGRPASRTIGLARVWVWGRMRLPRPASGMTTFIATLSCAQSVDSGLEERNVSGRCADRRRPNPIVAIVLHQALQLVERKQQPLAAATGAPLGELLADVPEGQRRVPVRQEDAEHGLQRRHVRRDVVALFGAAVSDDADRAGPVLPAPDLEAGATGLLVEHGVALLDLLVEASLARFAHP